MAVIGGGARVVERVFSLSPTTTPGKGGFGKSGKTFLKKCPGLGQKTALCKSTAQERN